MTKKMRDAMKVENLWGKIEDLNYKMKQLDYERSTEKGLKEEREYIIELKDEKIKELEEYINNLHGLLASRVEQTTREKLGELFSDPDFLKLLDEELEKDKEG